MTDTGCTWHHAMWEIPWARFKMMEHSQQLLAGAWTVEPSASVEQQEAMIRQAEQGNEGEFQV